MSGQRVSYLTPEQYLEIERQAEFRSEYLNGQIFILSGGERRPANITVTVSPAASTPSLNCLAFDQYLELEDKAEFRSEYRNGEMIAMAGATPNHVWIVANAISRLNEQLRGRPCGARSNDLRLYSPDLNVLTYPDVVVTCGPDKLLEGRNDVLIDATAIAEVLSPSTKNYDRGEKFGFYRSLPSFAEYFLLEQDRIGCEHSTRQPDGSWLLREFADPLKSIELKSIGCSIQLGSLYERVQFEPQV